jgi:glycosyltransferase involved in cell wall biosynthesis
MTLRLAIVVSHPIPHFAPLHREAARANGLDLRVFFCCDWGVKAYEDPGFGGSVQWDVPLLEGYPHEFLPIARRPRQLRFWEVDNPRVGDALDRFSPDIVKVHGYAHRTHWRVTHWTRRRNVPLLIFSDSNAAAGASTFRRVVRELVVSRFYAHVDGAFYVGDNNLDYHLRFGVPRERLFPGALPIDARRLLTDCPDPAAARARVRGSHGIPPDAFVVMLCAKLIARKRPADLPLAVGPLAGGRPPIWALLVGEGPLRAEIEDLIRRERIANAVLAGFVNQSRIADYYAASDALAMTSSRDNHPLVVSEAGVFGLPVIVSSEVGCIGANDTARPGINALVYPCGDRSALRAAVEALATDPALRARMTDSARAVAATQDARAVARGLASAAEQLRRLGSRRAPGNARDR